MAATNVSTDARRVCVAEFHPHVRVARRERDFRFGRRRPEPIEACELSPGAVEGDVQERDHVLFDTTFDAADEFDVRGSVGHVF